MSNSMPMGTRVKLSAMMFLQFMILPVWFIPMFPYITKMATAAGRCRPGSSVLRSRSTIDTNAAKPAHGAWSPSGRWVQVPVEEMARVLGGRKAGAV